MIRLSFYPIGDSYLLVLAAALVLLGLLALGPSRSKATRRRRAALAGIRLGVVALLILAMLRPTLVYTKTSRQSATLVLLVDQSRSMTVPDEVNNRTRFDAMRRALAEASGALGRLGRDFEVKAYTFDSEIHPADVRGGRVGLPAAPEGRQTAIGYALETVLRQEAGKRLLGLILLSDGAQRAYPPHDVLPQGIAAQLKANGDVLYTFPFGRSRGLGQAQDVAVTDLVLAEPRVFVKNQIKVTGQVRVYGYVNREIPIKLWYETSPGKMETVAMSSVRVTADGQLLRYELDYVPEEPGEHKLAVEAVGQPGELVTTNNQMSSFVNVLKGGLHVLYLEGTLRQESPFLKRSLDSSPEINVDFLRIDAQHPQTRPADFADRFQPGKYDVYILGDLDSAAFQGNELRDLSECVSRGAGLVMIGGFHSFGGGGYAETPLAGALPIRMDKLERQRFGEEPRQDLQISTPVHMAPTQIGLAHFTLMLAAGVAENRKLWSELPPLDGANRFDRARVKPAALVLATGDRDQPLLLAQVFGQGRVMAFAGDSTWRWWMHGFETAHKRFWRQVVLWLARKDESLEGNVFVKLAQRRFNPGQPVEFSVGVQTPTGEAVTGTTGQAEIVLPGGNTQPLALSNEPGELAGAFRQTETPGDYMIRVNVAKDGKPLGTARARFVVADQDLELDNAAADVTLLDNLAAITGGQSLPPEELPGLVQRLAEKAEKLEEKTETKETIWDSWPFFLLLVGLLGTEWYLRKRWGLV